MRYLALITAAFTLAACEPAYTCDPSNCGGCCDPNGVCQTGQEVTSCGANGFLCIDCGAGYVCSAGACAPACVPNTQCPANTCGQIDDGCGGVLECGGCGTGLTCGGGGTANRCGPGTCSPKSCTAQGLECGRASDGCSLLLDCGNSCAAPTFCGGGGAPNHCGGCKAVTCASAGKNCGSIPDGCGGTLNCGTCSQNGESCGGSGIANVCGPGTCRPTTCSAAGKNCGDIADGCGGTLNCGSCSVGTCGGGGTANVCGATCSVSCPAGFTCNGFGQCGGGNLSGLTLNEVGHSVSGVLRVNGAAPAVDSVFCADYPTREVAVVRFTEKTKGYSATVNVDCDFAFSTLLPPGTYEVRVDRGYYASSAMTNLLPVSYLAQASLNVNGAVSNLTLNEVGHAVSGGLRVNGAAPAVDSVFCADYPTREVAVVHFVEKTKGYSATVSVDCDFLFSTLLPPGMYEVRVDRGYYASSAMTNLLPVSYLAQASLNVNGATPNVVLNEIGHQVSGNIRVNSAMPAFDPVFCNDYPTRELAVVRFTERAKGYSATVSVSCSFAFSTLLPPGAYEVRVDRGYYASSAMTNLLPVSYLAQPSLNVNAPMSGLTLNEVGHQVSGNITVNGAPPAYDSVFCSDYPTREVAVVHFVEPQKGYSATVSVDCGFDFSTLLPAGTYEVRVDRGYYASSAVTNLLPVSYLAQAALVVSAPLTGVVLAETGHAVSGNLLVNGARPTADSVFCADYPTREVAVVRFVEQQKKYSATVSVTCSFTFAALLPPGTYEVRVDRGYYASSAMTNLLPVSYLAQAAMTVNGPLSNVVLAEVGRAVAGTITVNGARPAVDSVFCADYPTREVGEVTFTDAAKGYSASVSVGCNFQFSALLPPGSYDVRVDRGYYASSAMTNLLPVSYLAVQRLLVP